MSSHLTFLILGLGAGAVLAAIGLGLVVTYRTTGIINFAHAAIGMFIALAYYELRSTGDLVLPVIGLPERFHLIDRPTVGTALLIAMVYAAATGALLYGLIFRHVVDAGPLAGTVASLGLMLYLISLADLRFDRQSAASLVLDGPLPDRLVTIGSVVSPIDRYLLAVIVVASAVLLIGYFGFTRAGLTTRALAENREAVAMLGINPHVIGIANWVLAVVLSAGALILAAPIVRLDPGTTSLLIVPAVAAALPGRLTSIPITVAVGLALGMVQSEVLNLQADWDWLPDIGLQQGVPFLLVLATLAWRGALLPARTVRVFELPTAVAHRNTTQLLLVAGLAGAAAMLMADSSWRSALIVTLIGTIVASSVIVLAGLAGQVSLATYAVAGVAAFAMVRLGDFFDLGFPIAPIVAVIIATVLGVAIGALARGARGLTLTVASLAAAVAVEELAFKWGWFTGGLAGARVEPPHLFGWDLGIAAPGDAFPRRTFGVLVLVAAVGAVLAVINLRSGAVGRRWLAVRSNERAAAAMGLSVERVKLEAFAVSSALAGVAGVLIAYQREIVSSSSFGIFESIVALAFAYLAGLAVPIAALVAGILANGGLLTRLLDSLSGGGSDAQLAISGLLLIAASIRFRGGLVGRRRRRPVVQHGVVAQAGVEQ